MTLVIIGTVVFGITLNKNRKNKLVSPNLSSSKATEPSVIQPNTPKEIKFNRSTNLKEELDKVDPKVLDSDFE
ncbi:hypothetical protein A3F00_04305 [Candidatus Daviesbacteria bacterium RIFCSPHIGHO2_12_FULL_37_11]|uniref:Uncharacterized protein n=1 Tax=Candidatus Daviesbacteria bacterium RIFCSPHIGHO2_12_FULL_37_11 TaxID=1797777 RepID=A0A1F5K9P5_9BACT|nr:MAG: hypothetical protein A3F00_04305 [Candidatus Daviesbacteria bacterium RIFCSPHIGHO2_12_FULL_37_11]OGE45404.1 MAG: hypothetical protein A3B39_04705 [Candidatus Daviesbacteria bacterium RIFCSPLOWO2_01_FULL_37_10]